MIARIKAILVNHYLCCAALAALTLLLLFFLLFVAFLWAAIGLARWVVDATPAGAGPPARTVLPLAIVVFIFARAWRAQKICQTSRLSASRNASREGDA